MRYGFDSSLVENKIESLCSSFLQSELLNKKQCEGIVHLQLEVYKLSIFSEELDTAGIVGMYG